MKTLKVAVLSLFIAVGTIASANINADIPSEFALEQLRTFIIDQLQDAELNNGEDMKVKVSFYLTNANEIIVLKTDSNDKYVDSRIKGKMNYLKVPVDGLDHNETYHINVKFQEK